MTTPTAPTLTLPVSATPTLNGTLPSNPPAPPAPPAAIGANPDVTSNAEPTSPNGPSVSSSASESGSKSGGTSKATIGALGAVGGLAAVAALVFGFVLIKRRQRRQAREERWMDHNYSSTFMSDEKGGGSFSGDRNEYAFSGGVGPGAGGAAGLSYLEEQRDGYTSYHISTSPEATSSPSRHNQSTEYVIPHPAPPADQDASHYSKDQHEMSSLPTRPARSYQGEFDDPAPWDGQLGYFPQPPQQQRSGENGNIDLGYEYIQDYVASDPSANQYDQQQDGQYTSLDLSNNTDTNSNRQLSMRASSQLPADLEYFAQLREASWPMPPLTTFSASPTSPTSPTQSRPGTGAGVGTGSSPTQMPFLIPLARTLSHSGARQYDNDSHVGDGAGGN
ncbi:hypothetical protein EC991_007452 [Linnemannia zychae]|nr:hypothetical protein EC991_007452 [Linnemannia zychae]